MQTCLTLIKNAAHMPQSLLKTGSQNFFAQDFLSLKLASKLWNSTNGKKFRQFLMWLEKKANGKFEIEGCFEWLKKCQQGEGENLDVCTTHLFLRQNNPFVVSGRSDLKFMYFCLRHTLQHKHVDGQSTMKWFCTNWKFMAGELNKYNAFVRCKQLHLRIWDCDQ